MFWQDLEKFGQAIALTEGELIISYQQLADKCTAFSALIAPGKQLILLKITNDIDGVIAYLACLQGQHSVMLLDPDISQHKLDRLIAEFSPNYVVDAGEIQHLNSKRHKLDEDLALLLSTSGSTGSAKQVALSFDNLQANAASISAYLPIRADDNAVSTLPLYYSYGLSVLNSHLVCGANIVFTAYSFVNREFWQLCESAKISSFAAVPHSYSMLMRLRFTSMELPHLRYFTQAGGKLPKAISLALATYADANEKQFYMMYGQTEATARMAFLDPNKALLKPESIGQAVPNGQFELRDETGMSIVAKNQQGELFYSGPNVMLGYAQNIQQLSSFTQISWLATGDIGYFDDDGDIFITGRKKRIVKVFGQRISLDEVERLVFEQGIENICCGVDNKLVVALQYSGDSSPIKSFLSKELALHSSAFKIINLDNLPLTNNGKKDYVAVLELGGLLSDQ
jgi:acyl-CoA synthetase (AMP-forming)/AMP-acid ligase II